MAAPKKTMRALQYDKYGGGAEGLKHVEVPVPSPNKGEVLLKLEAASINPIDWKIQKGMVRPFLPRKFPFIPVGDISGEVVELGSGVTNFKPGDKVISISFATGGGLAEYAVAPASLTVARPPEVSAAEGASLPTAASTALQQLKAAGPVGHQVRRGGALRDGHPWSVFAPVLADRATVVDVTPGIAAAAKSFLQKVTFAKKRLVPLVLIPKKEEMEWLVDMTRQGKLKTVVDSRYPLSRAQEAWAKSIEGTPPARSLWKWAAQSEPASACMMRNIVLVDSIGRILCVGLCGTEYSGNKKE
ncbi:unnamed protein product [Miscanthus lutarioriparius]|uniref:Enoyl reductase (ER) domain-containing protein n=1 Tax=Miscanthus lutarioriparius TaxID=422564 RepID=A0A811N6I0_9POAL|nr:unnamed protein product [Miscanthus lutarioriparius]